MTTKIDYKRDLDCYQATRDTIRIVAVPDLQYLMIDGHGDPNTPAFADATATLYPVAYKLKFTAKALGRDHVVMPLEGLWWADDMGSFTDARDKQPTCSAACTTSSSPAGASRWSGRITGST